MSATPIEPQDIRVGDEVRVSHQFVVTEVSTNSVCDTRDGWFSTITGGAWELVSRPEPPREPGSLWYDPETNCVYSRTFYGTYTPLGEAGEKLLSQRGWVQMQVSDGSSTALRLVPWTKP